MKLTTLVKRGRIECVHPRWWSVGCWLTQSFRPLHFIYSLSEEDETLAALKGGWADVAAAAATAVAVAWVFDREQA